MNRHNLNGIIDDYEKKLLLYSSINNSKELTSLNKNYYEVLADIIINENNLSFEYLINRLENYFKYSIDIKENKLDFKHGEYSLLGSYVYKKLFNKFGIDTFDKYIETINKNISTEIYSWLNIDFDNSIIRDNFLNASTEYIIINQNKLWKEEFNKIDYKRYGWLKKVDNVPHSFESNEHLYFWLKENDCYENLMMIGNPIVKNLLHQIINSEIYNINLLEKNRIFRLLKECKNDYITIGEILTSNNIKLNCYLLKNNEYSIFGFCNFYMLDRLNIDESYAKEFLELLSQQLLDIVFTHLQNPFYQNDLATQAQSLVDGIQSLNSSLENEISDTKSLLEDQVDSVNNLLKQIVFVNKQIVDSNTSSYDLIDKRDTLEKELSNYVDIEVNRDSDTYNLKIAGVNVIFNNTNLHEVSVLENNIAQKDIYNSSDLDDSNFSDGDEITISLNNTTTFTLSANVSGTDENELKQQIIDEISNDK